MDLPKQNVVLFLYGSPGQQVSERQDPICGWDGQLRARTIASLQRAHALSPDYTPVQLYLGQPPRGTETLRLPGCTSIRCVRPGAILRS